MVLPRVTLRSVLRPKPESSSQGMATDVGQQDDKGNFGTTWKKVGGKTMTGRDDDYWKIDGDGGEEKDGTTRSTSILSRLLSRCTIKEPTFEEVKYDKKRNSKRLHHAYVEVKPPCDTRLRVNYDLTSTMPCGVQGEQCRQD